MKNLESTDVLENAPLVYVICKLDCGDLLSFDSMVEQSQELFRRNGFPIIHKQVIKDVHVLTDSGISIEQEEKNTYHFISEDYEDGVVVCGGSLFIQTKNYQNFERFAALVKKVYNLYTSITDISVVRGVGLRYINLIMPLADNPLSFYLNPEILTPSLGEGTGITPVEARMQYVYKTDLKTLLFLRVFDGQNQKMVPSDLIIMAEPLFLSAGQQEVLAKNYDTSAIVDIDHTIQFQPMKQKSSFDIVQSLEQMHRYTSHLFCRVVTAAAVEEWK